jgi:hypothetical protein
MGRGPTGGVPGSTGHALGVARGHVPATACKTVPVAAQFRSDRRADSERDGRVEGDRGGLDRQLVLGETAREFLEKAPTLASSRMVPRPSHARNLNALKQLRTQATLSSRRGAGAVERGGLENRCALRGAPWVQIPPPPFGKRFFRSTMRDCAAFVMAAEAYATARVDPCFYGATGARPAHVRRELTCALAVLQHDNE